MKRKTIMVAVVVGAVGLWAAFRGLSSDGPKADLGQLAIAPATKGNMIIDVLEAGNLESSDSLIIKSEVEGRTTIIFIVDEGITVTEEDIANQKVLVELDSAELREKEAQQSITVQSAVASLTDASASYEIQVKQNESNLKKGELNVKFALMDLEKYLGEELSRQYTDGQTTVEQMLDSDLLGGSALQRKRDLEINIDTNKEERVIAEKQLEWTAKLYEKGYVTRNDQQQDELSLQRKSMNLEKSKTEIELFLRYEFKKEAEKLLSDYQEAVRELDRIIARNEAELSKAEARLTSNQATYKRQDDQLKKIQKQIEKCKIVATRPGLVVYGGADNPWRTDNQIQEGVEVHERQEILRIPNTSSMTVTTKIHESVINRVREGLTAEITIDALPDRKFTGKVKQVGVLPETQSRWLNPNLKVYGTEIEIEGDQSGLRPGMSAQVRILVDEIPDALMVPFQSVTYSKDQSICFVCDKSGVEPRTVKVGEYNDKFIQILEGLEEQEQVVLNPERLRRQFQLSDEPEQQPETEEPDQKTADSDNEIKQVQPAEDQPMPPPQGDRPNQITRQGDPPKEPANQSNNPSRARSSQQAGQ